MAGRTNKSKTVKIHTVIPEYLKDQLWAAAEETGQTASEIVRVGILSELAKIRQRKSQ